MSNNKKTILIINNKKPMSRALENKLSAADFDVISVGNVEDGLREIEDRSPDLVITDLIMPDDDGFGMLEKIDTKEIPVFVLTSLRQDEDKERAKGLGIRDFFVETDVQLTDVVDKVEKFFA